MRVNDLGDEFQFGNHGFEDRTAVSAFWQNDTLYRLCSLNTLIDTCYVIGYNNETILHSCEEGISL